MKGDFLKTELLYDCFNDWLESKTVGSQGQHVLGSDGQLISDDEMFKRFKGGQLLDLRRRKLVENDDAIARYLGGALNETFE